MQNSSVVLQSVALTKTRLMEENIYTRDGEEAFQEAIAVLYKKWYQGTTQVKKGKLLYEYECRNLMCLWPPCAPCPNTAHFNASRVAHSQFNDQHLL